MPIFVKGKRTLGPSIQVRFSLYYITTLLLVSSCNTIHIYIYLFVVSLISFVIIFCEGGCKSGDVYCVIISEFIMFRTLVMIKECIIMIKLFILTGLLAVNTH